MIIKHDRRIFREVHEARKGLWVFSWLCFSDADWLGRKTLITWDLEFLKQVKLTIRSLIIIDICMGTKTVPKINVSPQFWTLKKLKKLVVMRSKNVNLYVTFQGKFSDFLQRDSVKAWETGPELGQILNFLSTVSRNQKLSEILQIFSNRCNRPLGHRICYLRAWKGYFSFSSESYFR